MIGRLVGECESRGLKRLADLSDADWPRPIPAWSWNGAARVSSMLSRHSARTARRRRRKSNGSWSMEDETSNVTGPRMSTPSVQGRSIMADE